MNEMKDKLSCETLEMLDKMIGELNKKANITPTELTALKEAYELRMELQDCYGDSISETGSSYGHYTMRGTYDGANMSSGSYGMYGARGRSPVTGRYISRDGAMHDDYMMSSHSIKDRMVARLENMYDEAKSEHERDEIRKEIRRIEAER